MDISWRISRSHPPTRAQGLEPTLPGDGIKIIAYFQVLTLGLTHIHTHIHSVLVSGKAQDLVILGLQWHLLLSNVTSLVSSITLPCLTLATENLSTEDGECHRFHLPSAPGSQENKQLK